MSRKVIVGLLVVCAVAAAGVGAVLRVVTERFETSAAKLVLDRPFHGKKTINVLLLGEDNTFAKDPSVRGRTDTIVVAGVDLENKRVQGISVPRDSRVQIPGRAGHDKINAAYVHAALS